jgi:hypothetical protein
MKHEEYMGIYSCDNDDVCGEDSYIIIRTDSNEDHKEHDKTSIECFNENSILTSVMSDFNFIPQLQQKCIGIYFSLLKTYSYMEIEWKRLHSEYVFFGYINTGLTYVWKKFQRFTCTHSIEPDEKEWINNIVFYRTTTSNGSFSYNIEEKYMMFDNNLVMGGNNVDSIRSQTEYYIKENTERQRQLRQTQDKMKSMTSSIFQQIEFIVMSKCIDKDNKTKYIVSLSSIPSENLLTSKAKFMSIEYTHPLMSESIPLEIPGEMFIVKNEILSPGFVLRALKHQKISYVFDMDYSIKVLDGMMNMFEMKSTDHIVFTDTGYYVKSA